MPSNCVRTKSMAPFFKTDGVVASSKAKSDSVHVCLQFRKKCTKQGFGGLIQNAVYAQEKAVCGPKTETNSVAGRNEGEKYIP